jgi:CRP-like cAMP-binding protein
VDRVGLASIPLFADCGRDELERFASRLSPRALDDGETLMREGETGDFFGLVVRGLVAVTRGAEQVAVAGSGSILGELALLRGRPRSATVTATSPTLALTGDADAFEALLRLTGVEPRLRRTVSQRLAANATSVPVTLKDGSIVLVRPLLPDDRARLTAELGAMSAESLRRRFFTTGAPSERVIDYLIDIDYTDHFAWVLIDRPGTSQGPAQSIATGRYVRWVDDPSRAELGFDVVDSYQGRGIGTLLLGALGVAAIAADIGAFHAEMLNENAPMRAVFAKAGATFSFAEPGVVEADLEPNAAATLLPPALRADLAASVRDVVTATLART